MNNPLILLIVALAFNLDEQMIFTVMRQEVRTPRVVWSGASRPHRRFLPNPRSRPRTKKSGPFEIESNEPLTTFTP